VARINGAATRNNMLAAHHEPPQFIGIIPQNNGGFGDAGKATDIFFGNEIEPLMQRMRQLNEWLGVEALVFAPYRPQEKPAA
jgi:capsid portal protein